MALLVAGCGGGGGGGGDSVGSGADLIVLATTPTNGQETLTDLSDPGLNGRLTLKFTDTPRSRAMIDNSNAFNGLTANVQILDQAFARVPGTPSIDPATRSFTFTPAGGNMDAAQYTVTVSKFVNSGAGKTLNQGAEDYSSSWTVGPDVYPPVVRNTSPAANQDEVPVHTPIVVTFNESLDPSTVVLGQTVFVQDGGTNPPTQLVGTLQLARNGFDILFVPDPCAGLPPATTVVVRLLGTGNTSFIRDNVGNGMEGNVNVGTQSAPIWEYQFQFNTKGTQPFPNPCVTPLPGSPRLTPFGGDYITATGRYGQAAYATTSNRILAFDVTDVMLDFIQNFTFRPELTVQVHTDNTARIDWCQALVGNFPYGSTFELDWRFDSATNHSYIYIVNESQDRISIVNTSTGKIEGHFKGVGSPKGITQTGPGSTGLSPMLFVTNFGQGTVTGIPLNAVQPGIAICDAVNALNDDISNRVFVNVGRNPNGIAAEFFGTPIVMVANQGDNEVTVFDPQSLTSPSGGLQDTFQVGESPSEVVWAQPTQIGLFAWIVNQGGVNDPDGSVSLWWSGAGGYIFGTNTGSVTGQLQDNIAAPGKAFSDTATLNCYVPNTASNTVTEATVTFQGGSIFATIQPQVNNSREVGPNPTSLTLTGGLGSGSRLAFVSLAGGGQIAVYDFNSSFTTPALYNLPGVRQVFSAWDQ
ncbi:MAG: Ig-like domain-containing protein [Planctomycetota bacterium]|jgi:hypothetical protein